MKAAVINYGAILVNLLVPDPEGNVDDVVLGYGSLEDYFENGSFFGATVGPNANRIGGASFELDGVRYQLDVNDGVNNLHSHVKEGYHKRVWDVEEGEDQVRFSLKDRDGSMGFPGNKEIQVTYTLTDENALEIHYQGSSDQNTIINMTNHTYFNLGIDIGFTVRERASRNVEVVPLFSEHHYLLGCLASDRRTIDPRTLDPHDELLTDWGSTFRAWHDSYFGLDHRPLAEVDTASSVFNYLADGVWCIVPASAVPFLQTISATYGHPVQVYEMTAPPPDRICYKVINRTPRPNRIDRIRYFEERLDIYLRENDLHL